MLSDGQLEHVAPRIVLDLPKGQPSASPVLAPTFVQDLHRDIHATDQWCKRPEIFDPAVGAELLGRGLQRGAAGLGNRDGPGRTRARRAGPPPGRRRCATPRAVTLRCSERAHRAQAIRRRRRSNRDNLRYRLRANYGPLRRPWPRTSPPGRIALSSLTASTRAMRTARGELELTGTEESTGLLARPPGAHREETDTTVSS